MIKQLRINFWLLVFFPMIITVITELNKKFLIWHIRIVDFVDLVVMAPFYGIILYRLTSLLLDKYHARSHTLSIIFLVTMLYGHSMHMTANAINTFSTEINNYRQVLPEDVYSLIFFFDEILGHWILYIGLFGLFATWLEFVALELKITNDIRANALFLGLICSITIIESGQLLIIPIVFLIFMGLLIKKAIEKKDCLIILRNAFMVNYSAIFIFGLLIGSLIYFLIFKGFPEPSTLY